MQSTLKAATTAPLIQGSQKTRPISEESLFLSIVIPAYNEEEVLPEFHQRLSRVFESIAAKVEFIYVNDGSTDNTLDIMHGLRQTDSRVAIVDLSRNFGKEIALTAGLDHARGDAAVILDSDLQHPPELIPELIKHWREGYDVVYAKRVSREGDNFLKRAAAQAFYRLIKKISRSSIPEGTGDYRLLSRRVVDSLIKLRERHRFMKGLFSWVGFSQKAVCYQPDRRYAGNTKWNFWSLWTLALEGITSFTTAPLKVATYLGLIIAVAAFLYGGFSIYMTLIYGNPVAGYPSLLVAILFLGGVQLITIGLIGEYLGRIFDETKQRPLYILKDYLSSKATDSTSLSKP
jgi:glycosyltransferase involved in cell wall biosynthesis